MHIVAFELSHSTSATSAYPPQLCLHAGLFSPALSVQRYSLVGAIAAALGCQDVLDVGCGGGRLLTHLGAAAVCGALPTLRTLRGCDISEPAIKVGSCLVGVGRMSVA